MTKLIFRSGIHTIGGTVVELIKDDNRIIFDFGTVFDPANSEEINPNVDGIYDGTSKYNDFVFISHIHLDHIKAINLIPQTTPIYMHSASVQFLDVLKTVEFEGLKGEFRDYSSIDQPIIVGGFKVTPLLVDHDVPGAVAFIFENEDIRLAYTGDIRLHGNHPERTYDFIKVCQEEQVDVLISEGVTISFIDDDYQIVASDQVVETEFEFGKRLESLIDPTKIQFFNPYIMGTERLQTFIQIANRINKKIALTPSSALIARKYFEQADVYVLDNDLYNSGYPVIDLAQIDNSWLVQFEYPNKDQYLKYMQGQELIQTGGEPLGDFDPRFKVFAAELEANNTKFIVEGLGGHASPENLQYICDAIAPTYTFPLHSFKPELLTAKDSIQIVAETDLEYQFEKGKLINN